MECHKCFHANHKFNFHNKILCKRFKINIFRKISLIIVKNQFKTVKEQKQKILIFLLQICHPIPTLLTSNLIKGKKMRLRKLLLHLVQGIYAKKL